MRRRASIFWLTFLVAVFIIGCATVTASAADIIDSGSCGNGVAWNCDSEGVLTVYYTGTGTGVMNSYTSLRTPPWASSVAIANKTNIYRVNIETGVTSIGDSAFSGNSYLTDVSIADTVTSMGTGIFSRCTSLSTISIPNGISVINNSTFTNCTSLTSISLPESVTNINNYAFNGCSSLSDVYFYGTQSQWDNITVGTGNTILDNAAIHTIHTGLAGSRITWTLGFDGILHLTGSGNMPSYVEYEREDGDNYFGVVAAPWDSYKDQISGVVIGEGIQSVGDGAFRNYSNISSVELPSTITSIGMCAFENCTSLSSIALPDGLKTIQYCAFWGCSGLPSVDIPDSVTSIAWGSGDAAFGYCSGLTSVKFPSQITQLGGFRYCTSLSSIEIPETVTTITYCAFQGCRSLRVLTIPASVTTIGKMAFDECTSLVSLVIEKGEDPRDISVGAYSFGGNAISSITDWLTYDAWTTNPHASGSQDHTSGQLTPAVLTSAFVTDYDRLTIHVPSAYAGVCGDNMTWAYNNGTLTISGTGSMYDFDTASGNYDSTAPWSSYRENISKVIFDGAVESIGNYAFYGVKMSSVELPDTLITIGQHAFEGCWNLGNVTLPDSLRSIGMAAFQFCYSRNFTSISIPEGVSAIEMSTLGTCNFLCDIHLPSTLTSIGLCAFGGVGGGAAAIDIYYNGTEEDWNNITKADMNEPLTAAKTTIHFKSIKSGNWGENASWTLDDEGVLNVTGTGVLDIDHRTELDPYKTSIITAVIGEGITSIGRGAFNACSALTGITLPSTITSIGDSAFSSCSALTTVSIPDGVTSIGKYAFFFCGNLSSVSLPDSLRTIGENAFYYCSSFYGYAPSGVTSIGEGAFYATRTSYFTVPQGISRIEEDTFCGCSYLYSINIPDSVTYIGPGAFNCGTNLAEVNYGGTHSMWDAITIMERNDALGSATINSKHEWDDPVWIWAADHSSATATFHCALDDGAEEIVNATIVSSAGSTATCTTPETTEYIASVLFEGQEYTGREEVEIQPAFGHDYSSSPVTLALSEDKTAMHAESYCSRDNSHIIAEDAAATLVSTTAASCTSAGSATYGATFETLGYQELSVELPTTAHTLQHMEAVAVSCEADGRVEHWFCTNCYSYFLDEECTVPTDATSVVIASSGHNKIHFDAVAATTEATGNYAYDYCINCRKYFDENGNETTLAAMIIPKLQTADKMLLFKARGGGQYWFLDEGNLTAPRQHTIAEFYYGIDNDDENAVQLTNVTDVVSSDPSVVTLTWNGRSEVWVIQLRRAGTATISVTGKLNGETVTLERTLDVDFISMPFDCYSSTTISEDTVVSFGFDMTENSRSFYIVSDGRHAIESVELTPDSSRLANYVTIGDVSADGLSCMITLSKYFPSHNNVQFTVHYEDHGNAAETVCFVELVRNLLPPEPADLIHKTVNRPERNKVNVLVENDHTERIKVFVPVFDADGRMTGLEVKIVEAGADAEIDNETDGAANLQIIVTDAEYKPVIEAENVPLTE